MLKIVFLSSLFFLTTFSCRNYIVESYDYDRDTPSWLKSKIDSIYNSGRNFYFGTEVNRYKWKNNLLFEFHIPLSSCSLCELYYYDGTKTYFSDDKVVQDYINNKSDKVLVWKWPKN